MLQLNAILLQAGGGSQFSSLIMIVALIVIFYFFMIRPQSKRQKEIKKAREAMQKGDRVVTAGGIHGRIKEVNDATLFVEIAPNTVIKIDKASVFPAADNTPAPASKKGAKGDDKEEKKD